MIDGQNDRWNFRILLGQGVLLDVSQSLSSPKLVLPFLYIALGAPILFAGLLIPIVQIARMIGQIASAPIIASAQICKWYLALGILTAAASLALIGLAVNFQSVDFLILIFLLVATIIGLGQGLSRLAFQNMLGYIIPMRVRSKLLFAQTGLSGLLVIGIAWAIHRLYATQEPSEGHLILLWVGIGVGMLAGILSMMVKEAPLANTEKIISDRATTKLSFGRELLSGIRTAVQVSWFRRFILTRALFLSVELATPFYAIHAAEPHAKKSGALCSFVIATGLGLLVGGVLWNQCSRWPLRYIMSLAAILASFAALAAIGIEQWGQMEHVLFYAVVFFLISIADQGISATRKIYLANICSSEERAYYIAISDTLIGGVGLVFAFLLGVVAHLQHAIWPILILGGLNIMAAFYALRLQDPPAESRPVSEE